jgi:hypothetical protein
LSEAPGAGGEAAEIAGAAKGDFAGAGHLVDAGERLEGAKEDAAGFAIRLAGDVEAIVIAVDEVNVGVARRAEKNGGSSGVAGGGVRGEIVFAEIGFDLDDAGGKMEWAIVAKKDFAQEVAGDAARVAGVEGTRKRSGNHRSGCSGWE